ncbi:response regulator transcription factor [Amycolatopsis oliviviridis]|uniref:DNA-binding response regulator n=1 Tax=Amycolatopsis oliviviridis TaxID=1471590 RepID=A0ABQ3L5W3_9PSEU|nr:MULTISPECIES: response regulator transcription factor [Amycolatopsis]GHH05650.1 DNA-binding response regulator [Amycolatopsis oliviviridis]
MTLRIMLVDDQDVVRAGLRLLLDGRGELEVVAEATDGRRVLETALRHRPDVIVMDIRMPETDGVDAITELRGHWPADFGECPAVLVLTAFDLDSYVYAALRAGANGFLLKTSSPDELAAGISVVAAGESILTPSITRRILRQYIADGPPITARRRDPGTAKPDSAVACARDRLGELTARELDVLRLIALGYSNLEIAGELDLSEPAVKSRVARLLSKLGLSNRVQAAIVAYETGVATFSSG